MGGVVKIITVSKYFFRPSIYAVLVSHGTTRQCPVPRTREQSTLVQITIYERLVLCDARISNSRGKFGRTQLVRSNLRFGNSHKNIKIINELTFQNNFIFRKDLG